jgi:hypothetical protein
MSELVQSHRPQSRLRYVLLATVSSVVLICAAFSQRACASEDDHPIVWIEVGGGLEQISADETEWLPPNLTPQIANPKPEPFGKLPVTGFDADVELSFTPEDSNWVYSASLRYGRAQHGPKNSHDQSYKFHNLFNYFHSKYQWTNYDFANTAQQSHSRHAIIDFMAGKDVGLGFLGGKSVISAGLRIAQLNETTEGRLTAFVSATQLYSPGEVGHKAELIAARSFSGIGPEVTWDASAPLIGSLSGGFSFDWGVNAAILFGRQKAAVSLHTKDIRYYPSHQTVLSQSSQAPLRNKTVVVPNVGGFAGLSWHLPNAKLSLGYRADFFFSAIDGGLESAKKETRGFYGPFATVSIGIGG